MMPKARVPNSANPVRPAPANNKPVTRLRDSQQREVSFDKPAPFHRLLTKLSTSFAGLPARDVDGALQQGLQQVVEWFGVERSTFAELSADGTSATISHVYAVPGVAGFPPKTVLRQFSWMMETLRRGEVIRVSTLEDLPAEASEEREYMRHHGFKANLSIPLSLGKSLIFVITLGSSKPNRTWLDGDVRRLRLLGEILANAVARQRSEEAILEGEKRRRIFLETATSVPWEIDLATGRFTYVGPQVVDLLGYPMERWFEPDFWEEHLHPDDRVAAKKKRRDLSDLTDRYEAEYRMIDIHGRVIWIHELVTVGWPSGRSTYLRGFMMDITETKHAEDTLRDLSGRLISVQEEERRRIARDLHDDINQGLALAATELEQLSGDMSEKAPQLAARAQRTIKRINDVASSVHALSMALHSAKLEHLGLGAALRALCRDLSRQGKLGVHFSEDGQAPSCRADVALCLYRVAQEAIQNALRHSGAPKAAVSLVGGPDRIELVIEDEGKGFDPALVNTKDSLGLVSMQERLRLAGGTLSIHSSPNGTRITATVPSDRGANK